MKKSTLRKLIKEVIKEQSTTIDGGNNFDYKKWVTKNRHGKINEQTNSIGSLQLGSSSFCPSNTTYNPQLCGPVEVDPSNNPDMSWNEWFQMGSAGEIVGWGIMVNGADYGNPASNEWIQGCCTGSVAGASDGSCGTDPGYGPDVSWFNIINTPEMAELTATTGPYAGNALNTIGGFCGSCVPDDVEQASNVEGVGSGQQGIDYTGTFTWVGPYILDLSEPNSSGFDNYTQFCVCCNPMLWDLESGNGDVGPIDCTQTSLQDYVSTSPTILGDVEPWEFCAKCEAGSYTDEACNCCEKHSCGSNGCVPDEGGIFASLLGCQDSGCAELDCNSLESINIFNVFGGVDTFCDGNCPAAGVPLCGCCEGIVNEIPGCTNSNAVNYNPDANVDDGSCSWNYDCDSVEAENLFNAYGGINLFCSAACDNFDGIPPEMCGCCPQGLPTITVNTPGAPQLKNYKGGGTDPQYIKDKDAFINKTKSQQSKQLKERKIILRMQKLAGLKNKLKK